MLYSVRLGVAVILSVALAPLADIDWLDEAESEKARHDCTRHRRLRQTNAEVAVLLEYQY